MKPFSGPRSMYYRYRLLLADDGITYILVQIFDYCVECADARAAQLEEKLNRKLMKINQLNQKVEQLKKRIEACEA